MTGYPNSGLLIVCNFVKITACEKRTTNAPIRIIVCERLPQNGTFEKVRRFEFHSRFRIGHLMSLEELNKNLYDPDSEIEKRKRPADSFDFNVPSQDENDRKKFQERGVWIEEKKGLNPYQKKALKRGLWIAGGIVILALVTIAAVAIRRSAFSEKRVTVSIEGPANIDSTQNVQYVIHCKNDNRLGLKNATIALNYSENFQPETATNLQILSGSSSKIHLGDFKPHSEKTVELKGKFYAPQDYLVYLHAALEYSPSGFSSVFQAQTQLGVSVKTSPIFLEITAPLETASNNNVEYLLNYRNLSSRHFSGARVKAEYPEGFEFSSADPLPSEGDNFWYLGDLAPNQAGEIKIRGIIEGSSEEGKFFKAYIGSTSNDGKFVIYTQGEKITKMVISPLAISQSVNGLKSSSVNAGETLNYVLQYKNTGNVGLRDAIITLEIGSSALDFSKMKLESGSYNSTKHMITWKASDLAELANLAPGAGGEIRFSIPVLERIPVKTKNDKNFVIVTRAKIDSLDVPTPVGSNKIMASDTLELKLNSRVILETFGYHRNLEIQNFGTLPPRVGKEISYVFKWKITNVSNDISGARVVSSLPSGVKWTGKIYPAGENITYKERSNEIVWEIGKLENAAGVLDPKREVSFQVSIIPQINQAGREAPLLNNSVFTAQDLFTEEEIKVEAESKTTSLPEDPTVGGNYKVEN